MPCSTNSGVPMIGCCGPSNPCPPDRIQQVATTSIFVAFYPGASSVDQTRYNEAMSRAQAEMNALVLEEGFSLEYDLAYRWDPNDTSFVPIMQFSLRRRTAIGISCVASTGASNIAWDATGQGVEFHSNCRLNKQRIACGGNFCIEERLGTAGGPSFNSNQAPGQSGGTVSIRRFAAGTYDLVPPAVNVIKTGFAVGPTSGNNSIAAYTRAALYQPCTILLDAG